MSTDGLILMSLKPPCLRGVLGGFETGFKGHFYDRHRNFDFFQKLVRMGNIPKEFFKKREVGRKHIGKVALTVAG